MCVIIYRNIKTARGWTRVLLRTEGRFKLSEMNVRFKPMFIKLITTKNRFYAEIEFKLQGKVGFAGWSYPVRGRWREKAA
jgi:hypothetical protein